MKEEAKQEAQQAANAIKQLQAATTNISCFAAAEVMPFLCSYIEIHKYNQGAGHVPQLMWLN